MARYEHAGGAAATTLVGDITDSATSVTVASGTGWPTGAGGKFWVVVDRDTSSEEKLLVNSRSGTSLTLSSAADRGLDGTSAVAHTSGATVEHFGPAATEADDWALLSAANTFAAVCTFSAEATFTAGLVTLTATSDLGRGSNGAAAAYTQVGDDGNGGLIAAQHGTATSTKLTLKSLGIDDTLSAIDLQRGNGDILARFHGAAPTALQTVLELAGQISGSFVTRRVSWGASDSGGTGKRMLVVDN